MSLQVNELEKAKKFSITQAILEQAKLKMEQGKYKSANGREQRPELLTGFETLSKIDDATIRKMMARVKFSDIITALIGADKATKEAILRNMDAQDRGYVEIYVYILEKRPIKANAVERSRILISEALLEIMREAVK